MVSFPNPPLWLVLESTSNLLSISVYWKRFSSVFEGLRKNLPVQNFVQTQEVFKAYALRSSYPRSFGRVEIVLPREPGVRGWAHRSPLTCWVALGKGLCLSGPQLTRCTIDGWLKRTLRFPPGLTLKTLEVGRNFSLTRTHRLTRNSTSHEPQPALVFSP